MAHPSHAGIQLLQLITPAGQRGALTMRFTMMILGPSVLLTVKMCISRRQKMIKARDSMMRPGYKVDGISLGTEKRKGNISAPPVWGFF